MQATPDFFTPAMDAKLREMSREAAREINKERPGLILANPAEFRTRAYLRISDKAIALVRDEWKQKNGS